MTARVQRAVLMSVMASLAACVSVAPHEHRSDGDFISGRISVQVEPSGTHPKHSVSANFDLQGSSTSGVLSLSGPLGSVLAQATWAPGMALLRTPDGEQVFANLDALTLDLLGESLPLGALFDWLRGRPQPDAPSLASLSPTVVGFEQLGWTIDLSRQPEGWIAGERMQPPKISFRARVDP